MADRIRIGIQLTPQHSSYDAIRAAATAADQLGADVVMNWDHFYPLSGDPGGQHFECWTMLGAWAESVKHAEIGALVTCNSYRNPDLLADMARTVDHISGGRLILGIGSGWFEKDYDSYGYEFGTKGSRLDDLAEAMPRILTRWDQLNPQPVRRIPVLIGGGGEKKTLRLVANYADIWHTFSTGDELVHKLGVLDRHCTDVGRDRSQIELSVSAGGDPDEVGGPLLDLGGRLFMLSCGAPYDLSDLERWIGWRDKQNG